MNTFKVSLKKFISIGLVLVLFVSSLALNTENTHANAVGCPQTPGGRTEVILHRSGQLVFDMDIWISHIAILDLRDAYRNVGRFLDITTIASVIGGTFAVIPWLAKEAASRWIGRNINNLVNLSGGHGVIITVTAPGIVHNARRQPNRRHSWNSLGVCTRCSVSFTLSPVPVSRIQGGRLAPRYVTREGTPVRNTPYSAAPIIGRLPQGTTVFVWETAANAHGTLWYRINDAYGFTGQFRDTWIYSGNLTDLSPQNPNSPAAPGAGSGRPGSFIDPPEVIWRQPVPRPVSSGSNSFVIRDDGSLWGWSGQNSPVHIMDDVVAISSGFHNMAIRSDGSLWGWGSNNSGEVGDGTLVQRQSPVHIMDGVIQAVATSGRTFAVRSNGDLYAWGSNSSSRNHSYLGIGLYGVQNSHRHTPVRILENIISVSASGSHALAIDENGGLWGWGDNFSGQLGNSNPSLHEMRPIRIMDGVVAVSAGWRYSLMLKHDGSLYAVGSGFYGNLGTGNNDDHHSPVRIMENVIAISASRDTSFAIKDDNTLWGWGRNGNGALGLGHNRRTPEPTLLMEDVAFVASAGDSTRAITTDGRLYVWGHSNLGGAQTSEGRTPHQSYAPLLLLDNAMMLGAIAAAKNVNTASNWAHEAIEQAVVIGLVPQDLQNNYTNSTTRAEFAALAVALYETITGMEIIGRMQFNDTNDIDVQKMGYLGVVSGVGSGNFAPNNTLTREQAAVMLVRLADAIGQPLLPSAPTFTDNADISSWAMEAVGQVQAAGIMGGVGDNQFNSQGHFTREQSIVTMLRLFEMLH